MLKVKHERPSQRLKHRVSVPLSVQVGNFGEYTTQNWSLNGFAVKDFTGECVKGDILQLSVAIPFQGFDISFACEAEVVRLDEENLLAMKIVQLDDRGQDLLTYFIEEIIRGSVTSADEVLRRIDTPVTPVTTSTEPDEDENIPVKRFSWKIIRMAVTHLIVGVIVFGYGGYFIYQNFILLSVNTAVISAPVNPLLSPINGYLSEIVVRPGENVGQKQVLMRLSDPELDNQIEFAKIKIDRKMMELRVRRTEFKAEIRKNDDFRRIAETKLKSIETELEHLKAKEILEDLRLDVLEEEYAQGRTAEIKLIEGSIRRIEFEDDLDRARKLLQSRRLLLDSIERGTLIHDNIESKMVQSRVKMELAGDELLLAKDELSALKKQQNWMDITAPADGQIAQWLRAPGTAVKKGEKLALFELDEARVIKAFLTPVEVLKVGLGDQATVYFPSLDRYVQAMITDIDATSGTLSARDIDYIWRRPNEPSARVTMQFVGINEAEVRQYFPSGLPATVVFNQREGNASPTNAFKKLQDWLDIAREKLIEFIRPNYTSKPRSEETSPEFHAPQPSPDPQQRRAQNPSLPAYPAVLEDQQQKYHL